VTGQILGGVTDAAVDRGEGHEPKPVPPGWAALAAALSSG